MSQTRNRENNEWVEIFFSYDEVESQIVKDLLEEEGIQVVVKSSKISPYPVSIGTMGEIRLLVRPEELKKGQDVLKAMERLPGVDQNDS